MEYATGTTQHTLDADVHQEPAFTQTDPTIAELEEKTAIVVRNAQLLEIIDAVSYEVAAAYLTEQIKPALKKIEVTWRPMQQAADRAKATILQQRRSIEQPLLEEELAVKRSLGDYDDEQDLVEAEAERVRQEAARKVAEQEKLDAAEHLEKQGHLGAAVERLDAPTVPVMASPAPRPKTRGVTSRPVYKFRVIDAAGIARAFLKIDEAKIGRLVRDHGADAAQLVGGIEVYQERQIGARAR